MDKYGLIGYPLGHSFSIGYFNEKFENEGIDAQYCNFEIPNLDFLPEIIAQNPDLKGLNVTIPYKEKIIMKGYNSDVFGFTKSIEPLLEKCHKKALILGTGGSSKAIQYGLNSLGIETLKVSRFERPGTICYQSITPQVIKEYKVIVNCTPCGMYPKADECPALPYEAMDSHTLLYDLIYNPDETLFMQKGAKYGATVKNGLEMLLLQAFESWHFWHSKD